MRDAVHGDPCEFVTPTPPYADEVFTEPRCYTDKPAVEIAREGAVELGVDADSLIVAATLAGNASLENALVARLSSRISDDRPRRGRTSCALPKRTPRR